jgi:hypothetical protein
MNLKNKKTKNILKIFSRSMELVLTLILMKEIIVAEASGNLVLISN